MFVHKSTKPATHTQLSCRLSRNASSSICCSRSSSSCRSSCSCSLMRNANARSASGDVDTNADAAAEFEDCAANEPPSSSSPRSMRLLLQLAASGVVVSHPMVVGRIVVNC